MAHLRAALVTPLSGPLSLYGRAGATALAIWAKSAALPPPWTSVALDVRGAGNDIRAAMQAALATQPDVLFGPYGSGPMLDAARACERVLWNHGGASSRLRRPAFPQVINVIAPASTYFSGALQAAHTVDPSITTISLLYSTTGFGRDVAESAATTAANLHLDLTSTAFAPSQAPAMVPAVPDGDVLLVVGNFADELAVASVLLTRPWRFAAFVGAGVDEVLTTLGDQREGLLGPAQWLPTAAIEPDEGPDSDWFVEAYRKEAGTDPPYVAAQAFAAGVLYARCLRDRAGNNRHSHSSRGSNTRMHNTLRQISARPFQLLTVGASGSDRPVATGETPCRVAARAGGMPRYFPLTVAASPSRPMNLGGTPPHRSWGHVLMSQLVEEEQTGVVTRRGGPRRPSGRKLGRGQPGSATLR